MTLRTTLLALSLLPLVACGAAFPTNEDSSSNDEMTFVSMGEGDDNDGDGYGERVDCDDTDADVNPGEDELCGNLIDDNCDGTTDTDGVNRQESCYDGDDDMFCDDFSGDGAIDQDDTVWLCEGTDENAERIAEQTGGDMDNVANYIEVDFSDAPLYEYPDADCDDADANTYPAAPEVCDGLDNDCDASTPVAESALMVPWYADMDADAFGNALDTVESCGMPMGYVADDTDCDDADANTYPGAPEFCDGLDNDCDASTITDEAAMVSPWYADMDMDAFGDALDMVESCGMPMGYVADDTDCDDANFDVNPNAIEVCDDLNVDEDCDLGADDMDPDGNATGTVAWYSDMDLDTFAGTDAGMSCDGASDLSTVNDDCDDANFDVNPAALEVEDGIDNNCDGLIDGADPALMCFDTITLLHTSASTLVQTIGLAVSDNASLDGEVYPAGVVGVEVTVEALTLGEFIIVEFEHCLDASTLITLDIAYDDGSYGCEVSGPAIGAIEAYQDETALLVSDGADDGSGRCLTEITE